MRLNMTPENFVYWLQGYFEIQDAYVDKPNTIRTEYLDEAQVQLIRDHLKLVLEKKTPDRKNPFSFTPPSFIPVTPSGIGTDPVYYLHNSPSPPASC
jgi:hypothetical protein